ncbi:MAG TPA: thiamine-phosphate kinase [Rhodocyclaceae bacterium]|nr:thiamine-phosphate kinase [Rhodocyclaceae bacterium]
MLSEFELIARYFTRPTPHTVQGVGDDGAIVRVASGMELVITTDMLVAGTHFLPDAEPEALGWKTLAVNVSDLAAMGARPRWAVVAVALPEVDEPWIAAFARGLFACADAFGIDVIGGDTTRGPINLCPTLFGEVPQGGALLRSGAQVGDEIWLSGAPGLAALGLAHLQGRCILSEPALTDCLAALNRPQPRVALGLALRGIASAAIDVSDGLLADLGHILERSGVAATVHLDRLPGAALGACPDQVLARDCLLAGGDDYELLFAAAPGHHAEIAALAGELGLALTCIGSIVPGNSLTLQDVGGRAVAVPHRGFDHFAGVLP